jgi:hypothetical protein
MRDKEEKQVPKASEWSLKLVVGAMSRSVDTRVKVKVKSVVFVSWLLSLIKPAS